MAKVAQKESVKEVKESVEVKAETEALVCDPNTGLKNPIPGRLPKGVPHPKE